MAGSLEMVRFVGVCMRHPSRVASIIEEGVLCTKLDVTLDRKIDLSYEYEM